MDLSSAAAALVSLENLTYLGLFALFFVEGPIATYIASFAASLGFFNPFYILLLSFFGNICPDLIYYTIGHKLKGSTARDFLLKRGVTHRKMDSIKEGLRKHAGKMMVAIKIMPLLPIPGLTIAGMVLPLRKFIFYSWIISAVYSLVFFLLGYFSGRLYGSILGHFNQIEFLIILVVLLGVGGWYVYKKYLSQELV